MTRRLFLRTLRDRRLSVLSYALALVGFLLMYTALYPSVQDQVANFSKIVESFPKPLLEAFGLKSLDFASYVAFISTEYLSLLWPLIAIIFTISLAGRLYALEVERHTAAILLALPLGRARIFWTKYLAGLALVVTFVLLTTFAIIPVAAPFGISVELSQLTALAGICLLFALAVYSLATLASVISSEKGRAYLLVGSLLTLMYVANIISALSGSLDWLKYGSLFHYFSQNEALVQGHIGAASITFLLGVSVVSVILAQLVFSRRDFAV